MRKTMPFLWFDNEAEEAANFYVSAFRDAGSANSRVCAKPRHIRSKVSAPGSAGPVMGILFELDGQPFIALNGGPIFKSTQAISFVVNCERQEEVDHFWTRLGKEGTYGQCGWLKDRFGVSWQVVPNALGRLMADPDPARSSRVMDAMLRMTKLDIGELERAYAG